MTVYVDDASNPFGRMKMCHMVADTLDELHTMAEELGIEKYFQENASSPHYDVSKRKREWAIKLGAVEVKTKALIPIAHKLRDELWEKRVLCVWLKTEKCQTCKHFYSGDTSASGDDPSECTLLQFGGHQNLKLCPGVHDDN